MELARFKIHDIIISPLIFPVIEHPTKPTGSGRYVDDFTRFCEGDVEPTLNKRIRTLIDCSGSHIVYLDDDLYVEWAFTHEHGTFPSGFDSVANRIGHLETISITQLSPTQREPFGRLLAEAMARTIGDRSEKEAQLVLDKAEAFLKARGSENARRWYLYGVFGATLIFLTTAGILLSLRHLLSDQGRLTALDIAIGAAMGSLGSLISIAGRTEAIHLEPVAGPGIHRFEGATRVVVGVIAALFVAVGIKADLLLGVFHSLAHPFLALIAACVIAGASERLVPGLINNMGKHLNSGRK